MAAKKDNLPLSLDQDQDTTGTITYANEVIAIISGVAANEVEGIAGMCTSGGISDVFGRNKNITRGVRVEIGTEETSVDLYVIVEYGTPIQTAALNVQENVRKAVESMTGLHVVRIDVHVQGVSFEKDANDMLAGLENVGLCDSITADAASTAKEKKMSSAEDTITETEVPASENEDAAEAKEKDVSSVPETESDTEA